MAQFITGNALNFGARTNSVIPAPYDITNGNLLIAVLALKQTSGAPPSVTPPAGWTEISSSPFSLTGGSNQSKTHVYYKIAASESGSYTFTHTAATDTQGFILNITGVNTSTPIDAQVATTGTGTGEYSSGITNAAANEFTIYISQNWRDTSPYYASSLPAGYQQLYASNMLYCAATVYGSSGATGTVTPGANHNTGSDPWGSFLISFTNAALGSTAYVVSSNSIDNTGSAATSLVVPPPPAIVNGNLLLMAMVAGNASAPTVTTPAGWTDVPNSPFTLTSGGSSGVCHVWYKIAASESGSYTITTTSAYSAAYILNITGNASSSPIDATTYTTGTGTGENSTGVTTAHANELVIYASMNWFNITNSGPSADPSGYTGIYSEGFLYCATKGYSSAGATGSVTPGANGNAAGQPWSSLLIALAPGASTANLSGLIGMRAKAPGAAVLRTSATSSSEAIAEAHAAGLFKIAASARTPSEAKNRIAPALKQNLSGASGSRSSARGSFLFAVFFKGLIKAVSEGRGAGAYRITPGARSEAQGRGKAASIQKTTIAARAASHAASAASGSLTTVMQALASSTSSLRATARYLRLVSAMSSSISGARATIHNIFDLAATGVTGARSSAFGNAFARIGMKGRSEASTQAKGGFLPNTAMFATRTAKASARAAGKMALVITARGRGGSSSAHNSIALKVAVVARAAARSTARAGDTVKVFLQAAGLRAAMVTARSALHGITALKAMGSSKAAVRPSPSLLVAIKAASRSTSKAAGRISHGFSAVGRSISRGAAGSFARTAHLSSRMVARAAGMGIGSFVHGVPSRVIALIGAISRRVTISSEINRSQNASGGIDRSPTLPGEIPNDE